MSANPIQDQFERIRTLIAQQHDQIRLLAKFGEDILVAQVALEEMLKRSAAQTAPEGVPAWVVAKRAADASRVPQELPVDPQLRQARPTACPNCHHDRVYRSRGQSHCASCSAAW